jgi:hypothetical protein
MYRQNFVDEGAVRRLGIEHRQKIVDLLANASS